MTTYKFLLKKSISQKFHDGGKKSFLMFTTSQAEPSFKISPWGFVNNVITHCSIFLAPKIQDTQMAEAVSFVNAKICFPIKLSYYQVFWERCYHCIMQLYDFMMVADEFTRRAYGKYSSRSINLKLLFIKILRLAGQFLSLWDYPHFINITVQTFSDRFCFSLVMPFIELCPNSSMHQDLEIWQQGLGKPRV